MTIVSGDLVRTLPPTSYVHDDISQVQLASTSYETGSPEVGVYFVGPASGKVRLTVGAGIRDNGGSNLDRVFVSPQLFEDSASGVQILAPSVTLRGYAGSENLEYQYGSRVSLIEGLTPGQLYYVRLMHLTDAGTDPDSADIAARDLIVIPLP